MVEIVQIKMFNVEGGYPLPASSTTTEYLKVPVLQKITVA